MSMKEIATKIAKAEGKKTQARIGEVREILAILSELMVTDVETAVELMRNGHRRLKSKGNKK